MVASLKEVDSLAAYLVNEPVLLSDPSGPCASEKILERLRLANSSERIPQNCFHQLQDPQCRVPVRLHPPPEIFSKLRVEHGFAFTGSTQAPTPAAACRLFRV